MGSLGTPRRSAGVQRDFASQIYTTHMDLSMLTATARPARRIPHGAFGEIFHSGFSRQLNSIAVEKGMAVPWGIVLLCFVRQQRSKTGIAADTDYINIHIQREENLSTTLPVVKFMTKGNPVFFN